MSKELDLGPVRARINGQTSVTIVGGQNIDVQTVGDQVTISVDGEVDNAHFSRKDNPHQVTAAQAGAVPTGRKINGKTLTTDISLNGSDVGVVPGTTAPKMDGTAAVGTDAKFARADHVHPHDTAKQDKLTGTRGQVVGFNDEGNAVPIYMDDSIEETNPAVYGFELNLNESDPDHKIRYIGANSNFAPAKMNYTTGVFDYGDWGNVWFIQNIKPVVLNFDGTVAYELNKNDYTKKVDNTASNVASDSLAGNVMVGIPTVYVRIDASNPQKPKFYFAATKINENYFAFAHTDANGKIIPYFYRAAYDGWKDGDNKLRSISGKSPTRDQTGTVQITEARANNPTGKTCWDIDVLSDRQLLSMLLMLIGKSTNTQAVFGNGNMNGYQSHPAGSDGNGVLPSGTMNTKGLFWGSNNTNSGVKVFGIENFWGNIWKRTQGLILDTGKLLCKLTKGKHDGSGVADYNETGEGYIDTTVRLMGQTGITDTNDPSYFYGFINRMFINRYGLFPDSNNGSESTDFCDRLWYRNTDKRFALFGGGSNYGSPCGVFACALTDAVSASYWNRGAAVSCKPAA